jgi:carboxypeptidase PM20D1
MPGGCRLQDRIGLSWEDILRAKTLLIAGGLVAAVIGGLALTLIIRTVLIGPPPIRDGGAASRIYMDQAVAAERLAQALRIRTVSLGVDAPVAADAFADLHSLLVRNYPRLHATLKREVVSDHSLLYTWPGSDPEAKPIALLAHLDVAPIEAGSEQSWTHSPFAGAIADGYIWGRGAIDMKQSLIAIAEAVEYLLETGFEPRRTVYLAFGHDEEIGGRKGAAVIAERLAAQDVRLEFTLDEGSAVVHDIVPDVDKPVALIGIAEKGILSLELTATDKGGHSSMPPATTAVGRIARAIHLLETHQMEAALRRPLTDTLEYLAPEMPFLRRMAVANIWLFEPLVLAKFASKPPTNATIRTTTAATVIEGGIKPNVLPKKARAAVNFRILPGETIDDVIAHVGAIVDDPAVGIRPLNFRNDPQPISDINSASFALLQRTVHQSFPDAVIAPSLVVGATDSRHYAAVAENSYRFLPMRLHADSEDLKRLHGTNERIALENYVEIIGFYTRLLQNAAGAG